MKDEFDFIQSITPKDHYQSSLLKGIGDDAALLALDPKFEQVVCVDTMVEGVHFRQDTLSFRQVGYKALAVNISDIAAMGGIPSFYLVSIAIPKTYKQADIEAIYQGMTALASQFQMDLIGGDTVSTEHKLVLTVTVIGYVKKGKHFFRNKAMPGDVVFITNTIGDSSCGLDLLLTKGFDASFNEKEQEVIKAHQMPFPQVKAGQLISTYAKRAALNDISDGISSEANEIASASEVSLVIDYDCLPINPFLLAFPKKKYEQWVLSGGEDYQLIGTASKEDVKRIQAACQNEKIRMTIVGYVDKPYSNGQVLLKRGDHFEVLLKKGFNHFSSER